MDTRQNGPLSGLNAVDVALAHVHIDYVKVLIRSGAVLPDQPRRARIWEYAKSVGKEFEASELMDELAKSGLEEAVYAFKRPKYPTTPTKIGFDPVSTLSPQHVDRLRNVLHKIRDRKDRQRRLSKNVSFSTDIIDF